MQESITIMHPQTRLGAEQWLDVDRLGTDQVWRRWRDHYNHPPLFNDLGSFRVSPGPMGIRDFMMPPFAGKGEGTANLYINRKHPASEGIKVGYTWYPDRVYRCATFDGVTLETVTFAAAGATAGVVRLKVTNPLPQARTLEVGIKVAGRLIHTLGGWASIGPEIALEDEHAEAWHYDPDLGAMCFESDEKAFMTQGSRPAPDRVEGKTLLYDVTLEAGGSWALEFVVAMGETRVQSDQLFLTLAHDAQQAYERTRASWNEKIRAAFTPGNGMFSGHLPMLETGNEALARLYYMTAVGCLCLRRTHPLSQYGTAYVTLSPNYWTTATFLWDMMIAGPFYALLDPAVMRTMIEVWLTSDLRKILATDYVTGRGLGYWYAVNSSAIVRLAHDYVRYSGDVAWLGKMVGGRLVVDMLEEHALAWHEYDHHGHGLADCGGVINLLECVSTYTHGVAAFNAMWVAALRQVAAFRRLRGEDERAEALTLDAQGLLERTLELYAQGKGYWRCRQPDGSHHDVHHIYDFVAVLESIADDLPEPVRREMVANFRQHHQTHNWVRSLAAWDDDSHRGLRVDHQWTGSYTSIPAQSINGLYRCGCGEEAYQWLTRVARVAAQGPVGQAHWVDPIFDSVSGGAYKCSPMVPFMTDWTCASNGAYPAMVIESVFGARGTLGEGLVWHGTTRGLDAEDRLENLACQGRNYRVDGQGIHELA